MTELHPYPAYRDSGVDWVGMVPEHWEVRRLRTLSQDPIANGVGESAQPFRSDWPRYVRITDIAGPASLHDATAASLPPERATGAMLAHGDLVFAAVGATYGKSFLYLGESDSACFAGYLVRLRPKPGVSPSFLSYWAQAGPYWEQVHRSVIQATIQNLSASRYKRFEIALPPLPEQRAIAQYLDHADQRIRGYIRAKERLIELLEEEKQARIRQAVTGQIDVRTGRRYPAYKDSGAEWLGKVPEHWEVRRLKTLSVMHSGDAITAMSIDKTGDYPVYGGNGVRGYTSSYTHDGDFVLIGRQGALCGNIHLAHGLFWASEHAVVVTLRIGHLLGWFGALLRVMDLNQYSIAAAQPGLSVDRVMNLWAPVPPIREQRLIAERLVERSGHLQKAVEATKRQIALLREYRTRLIADVVTGKLDVRGAAAELSSEGDSIAGRDSDRR